MPSRASPNQDRDDAQLDCRKQYAVCKVHVKSQQPSLDVGRHKSKTPRIVSDFSRELNGKRA